MDRDARVSWFVTCTFIFFSAYCWSLAQAWVTFDVRWLAISFGSIGAIIMLIDRKRQHDDLCLPSVGISLPAGGEQEKQTQEVQYRPQIQSENGQRIRYAKFAFTKVQWTNLARVIFESDDRITRDVVDRAKVFTNLSGKWPHVIKEFERLAWVESGKLTDAGKQWFMQFITPPPY